jgi:hypothetical protein
MDEMDMPTPCPTCTRIVELNDMSTCENCNELFCDRCCEPWGLCAVCKESTEGEYRDELNKR